MQFKTTLAPLSLNLTLKHEHRVLALGSCFSEHMMERLKNYKFNVLNNPQGILFSPVAIFNALVDIFLQKEYTPSELEQKEEGTYFHYQLHSSYNDRNAERLVTRINHTIRQAHAQLQQGDYLFLTFGSAWTYQQVSTKRYVANCHQQPNYLFEKVLMKPEVLIDTYSNLLEELHRENKKLHIVFSVSPIRHLKDGFIENQRSKAILLYFIHELVERFDFCHYFPAYEIMMDDLRDYRFYKDDLLHLSDMALDYIWSYFEDSFFSPFTQNVLKKIQHLQQNLAHRPFEKNEKYYLFLQKSLGLLKSLEMELPFVSFEKEKQQLKEAGLNLYAF